MYEDEVIGELQPLLARGTRSRGGDEGSFTTEMVRYIQVRGTTAQK